MKIRQGFVSNSSSSSFVVYGFKIEYGENFYKFAKDFLKTNYPNEEIDFDDEDSVYEKFQDQPTENRIAEYVDGDNSSCYIGRVIYEGEPEEMEDSEYDTNDDHDSIVNVQKEFLDLYKNEKDIVVCDKIKIYTGIKEG